MMLVLPGLRAILPLLAVWGSCSLAFLSPHPLLGQVQKSVLCLADLCCNQSSRLAGFLLSVFPKPELNSTQRIKKRHLICFGRNHSVLELVYSDLASCDCKGWCFLFLFFFFKERGNFCFTITEMTWCICQKALQRLWFKWAVILYLKHLLKPKAIFLTLSCVPVSDCLLCPSLVTVAFDYFFSPYFENAEQR